MVDPIPQIIKRVWEHWNIRGVMLFSLSLQIFLTLFAPMRKRSRRVLLKASMWSTYLLADYAANYCVGLISNSQLNALKSSKSVKTIINTNSDLLAFWTPFLLLHVGGPDTITALALEDNELWLRHLFGFVSQAVTCAYVFMLSMPGNALWLPTVLIFVAGIVKYGERTWFLYRGRIDNFREGPYSEPNYQMLKKKYRSFVDSGIPVHFVDIAERELSDTSPNDTYHFTLIDEAGVVQRAFYFFNKFKGLIADMMFSFSDRNESRKYFRGLSANDALRVIEVELNFFYEAFYTKFLVVQNVYGFILRLVTTISITYALAIFHSTDKEKFGFDGFDVRVTYALLCGAVALDFVALFGLIFSDRTLVSARNIPLVECWLRNKRPNWKQCKNEPYKTFRELSTTVFFGRWNGSMFEFNFIKHCLDQRSKGENPSWGIRHIKKCCHFLKRQYLKHLGYSTKPFFREVWDLIFAELKSKSAWAKDLEIIHRICDARGEWVINRELSNREEEEIKKSLLSFVDVNKVAFDQSLIVWHIATHLCCKWEDNQHQDQNQPEESQNPNPEMLISQLISDYMMYLLIFQSKMTSSLAGIGMKRFQDTLEEAKEIFQEREIELGVGAEMETMACNILREVDWDIKAIEIMEDESRSLLFDACRLAKELMKLKKDLRWRIISRVWVEILSFAATNCSATAHVQQLSKGGELISLVWLLMVRLGLGKQYYRGALFKMVVGT